MVSVTVLADVTAAIDGSTKKLLKGSTYDLPDDVARDLARDGYVEITSGSARLQKQAEMANPDDIAESRGRFNTVPELGAPDAKAVRRAAGRDMEPEGEVVDIYAEHEAEKHRIEQSVADRIADTFKEPSEKTEETADKSSLRDIHATHESEKAEIEKSKAEGVKDTTRIVDGDPKSEPQGKRK